MTKPSRVTSYGRDAVAGSSLRRDSACIDENDASVIGWIDASVPPAMTTSARPELQVLVRVDDRLGARRARRRDGAGERAGVEVHRERDARGGIRHEHRHRRRQHPARALLAQRVPAHPAGSRARRCRWRSRRRAARGRPPARRHPPRPRAPAMSANCDDGSRRLISCRSSTSSGRTSASAANVDGKLVLLDPVVLERAGAGLAGEQRIPRLGRGAAERRRCADAGDDDLLGQSLGMPGVAPSGPVRW